MTTPELPDNIAPDATADSIGTPSRLQELAMKYGSDKLHSHSYIPFYESLFRDHHVSRLLEIGIGFEALMKDFTPEYHHGSSLYMWRDYFPNAGIFSCDIREDTLINEDRIWSRVCDQSKYLDLRNLAIWSGGEFDVIIDDGSHETDHQILTAAVLLPHLRNHGVYVIEDVREPERLRHALGGVVHQFTKRPDDCLLVIER